MHNYHRIKSISGLWSRTGNEYYPFRILESKAGILLLTGRWDQAEAIFRNSIRWAGQTGHAGIEAKSKHGLGDIQIKKGEFAQAAVNLGRALELYREQKDASGIISVISDFTALNTFQGEYQAAMQNADQQVRLAEENRPEELSSALNNKGNIYIRLRDFDKALECYERAAGSAEKYQDAQNLMRALGNQGNIHWHCNRLGRAMQLYQKVKEIAQKMGDKQSLGLAFNNIGNIHYERRNFEEACDNYQRQLTLSREMGDYQGVMRAVLNIGLVREMEGDIPKATEDYKTVLEMAQKMNEVEGIIYSSISLGQIHIGQKQYAEGMEILSGVIELTVKIGDLPDQSRILGLLGRACLGLGRYEQAADNFTQAIAIDRQVNKVSQLVEHQAGLAEALRLVQRTAEAEALEKEVRKLTPEANSALGNEGVEKQTPE